MPHLIGPGFIGIQAEDIEAARTFYTEVAGLKAAPDSPAGAVLFDTKPIPFAVQTSGIDGGDKDKLGLGIALWFTCDDADAFHDHLVEHGTPIASPLMDGPFGRFFAFRDPFGYTMTAYTPA